ncbi:MAG: carboxypeptidase regulatory-like domain-containing protein [Planctomycetes bacterium]|nr:carboxypeptidase regulatory-like domain-containing protein [Planctomycetota bacterium]
MKRAAWGLGALVLVGLAAFYVAREPRPRGAAGLEPQAASHEVARDGGELAPASAPAASAPVGDAREPARVATTPRRSRERVVHEVRGRVVDEQRAPIAGAWVRAWFDAPDGDPDGAEEIDLDGDWGELRDDGSFWVAVQHAGALHLLAGAKHRVTSDVRVLDLGASASTVEVELVVGAGLTISGAVVDAFGQPVAGAAVTAYADLVRRGVALERGVSPSERFGALAVVTGPSGEFELRGARPGATYTLAAVQRVLLGQSPERNGPLAGLDASIAPSVVLGGDGLARAVDVPAGASDVQLRLGTVAGASSRLELTLATHGGGALPGRVLCQLLHLAPDDELLSHRLYLLELDERGVVTIAGLRTGDDYVALLTPVPAYWQRSTGTFRAQGSLTTERVAVPGLHPAEVALDPQLLAVAGTTVVEAVFTAESGREQRLAGAHVAPGAASPAVLNLPAGRWPLRVRRGARVLLEQDVDMPDAPARFTLRQP